MILINLKKYRVIKDGKEINLTPLEFKLLKLLSGNNPVTYQEMTKYLYGDFDDEGYFKRCLQQVVSRLKRKMNLSIFTLTNRGYKLLDDVYIE